ERAKRLRTDNCLRTSLRFMVTPKGKEGESGGRRDPCEQHTGVKARPVPIFGVRNDERLRGLKWRCVRNCPDMVQGRRLMPRKRPTLAHGGRRRMPVPALTRRLQFAR